jgi:hypothetical protein
MFTFGREHERKCEARYVRQPTQIPLLMSVVDAVHDLIEGGGSEENLTATIRTTFVEGGSGVWENAGRWLRKSAQDYPNVLVLWSEFATHSNVEVRFRTACMLNDMPANVFSAVAPLLRLDRSKKVARMAGSRISERGGAA